MPRAIKMQKASKRQKERHIQIENYNLCLNEKPLFKKHVPLVGKFAQNNKKLFRPHSNILETIWGNPIH